MSDRVEGALRLGRPPHRTERPITLLEAIERRDRARMRVVKLKCNPDTHGTMEALVAKMFLDAWQAHVDRLSAVRVTE